MRCLPAFLALLCVLVNAPLHLSTIALAGNEDQKEENKPKPPPEPEAPPAPTEPEAPDLSLGDNAGPQFKEEEAPQAAPAKPKRKRTPWDPDKNMDYSEALGKVEPEPLSRGVLAPALGFRGYRPNMIAIGYFDRTPGVGGIIEYSWNRLGLGGYYSYRDLPDDNQQSIGQSFGGAYLLYRWLPFNVSPYFLLGLEIASQTPEKFGGTAGLGVEARIYYGWTALLGYTYHTTAKEGFLGGAFGWSF